MSVDDQDSDASPPDEPTLTPAELALLEEIRSGAISRAPVDPSDRRRGS